MKVRLKHNPDMEDDVVIEYREMTPSLESMISKLQSMELQVEYRGILVKLPVEEVIFFESDDDAVFANTISKSYRCRYRLYELEGILPINYIRVSKSQIVNVEKIESIERTLSSSRTLTFYDSNKIAYVSRMYYGALKQRLKERGIK